MECVGFQIEGLMQSLFQIYNLLMYKKLYIDQIDVVTKPNGRRTVLDRAQHFLAERNLTSL